MDFFLACKNNVANVTVLSFIDPRYHADLGKFVLLLPQLITCDLERYTVMLKTENREIQSMANEDYVTTEMVRNARFRKTPNYFIDDQFFASMLL
jgi:hypothetical protein